MVHPRDFCSRSPRFGNLVKFEVDDRVREYQRLRSLVEENELLEIATGEKRLVDFSTSFFGRIGLKVSREVDINMPGTRPLAHARRCPRDCIGKRLCPFPYMRIVELVRRHEMTNRPQPQQPICQSLVELDRRMEEEVAV